MESSDFEGHEPGSDDDDKKQDDPEPKADGAFGVVGWLVHFGKVFRIKLEWISRRRVHASRLGDRAQGSANPVRIR